MIRILGILLFVFFAGDILAQNISQGKIPALVVNVLQSHYSPAEEFKWELENGNYLVYFRMNSKSNKQVIDYKGKVLKNVQNLFVSEITKVVQETIRKKVVYFDISDGDKLSFSWWQYNSYHLLGN